MKWQYFVAVMAALIMMPAIAGMKNDDRKAPSPTQSDRMPAGYIYVEGVPDLKVKVENWILEMYDIEPGATVPKRTFLKIYRFKRRQLR